MGQSTYESQTSANDYAGLTSEPASADRVSTELHGMSYEEGAAYLSPSGQYVSGDVYSDQSWSYLPSTTYGSVTATDATSGVSSATGQPVVATSTYSDVSSTSLLGQSSAVEAQSQALVVDEVATLAARKDELRRQLVPLETAIEDKRVEREYAEAQGESTEALDQQIDALETHLVSQREAIDNAKDAQQLGQVASDLGVDTSELPTAYKADSSESVVSTASSSTDISGRTHTTVTQTSRTDGGVTQTASESNTYHVGAVDGGVGASAASEASRSVTQDGVTDTHTETLEGQVTMTEDGVGVSGSYREADTLAAGGESSTTATTYSAGGTFDGETLSGQAGVKNERPGGTTTSTTVSGSLTNDSVTGGLAHNATAKDESGTTTFACGGNATITMDVQPVPGSNPPQYQSVFTAKAGGSLKVGRSAEGETTLGANTAEGASGETGIEAKGSAGLNVSGTASVVLTHTLVLTPDELASYRVDLAEWQSTGKAPSALSTFDLDRLRVLGDQRSTASGVAAALGGADAAASLRDGESYALDINASGTLGGQLGGSAEGVGIEASAQITASTGRQVTVARGAGGLVTLTVSYKSAEALAGELGVTVDVVKTKLGAKSGETQSVSGTFQLHTDATSYDYGATYDRILSADRAALRQLVEGTALRDLGITVTGSVGQGTTGSSSVEVGAFAGAASTSSEQSYSESLSYGEDGALSGTFTGANGQEAGVSAGVIEAASKTEDSGTFSVDSEGDLAGTITETETATLPTFNPDWTIKEWLVAAYPEYSGLAMSAADMEAVISRAGGDETAWRSCCEYNQHRTFQGITTYDAWSGLQGRLRAPSPPAEWTAQNPEAAASLARGKALAEYMQWPDAASAFVKCATGYRSTDDLGHVSDGRIVGARSEWTGGLAPEKAKYDQAVAGLARLPSELTGDKADPANGLARGLARCRDLSAEFMRIRGVVEAALSEFETQAIGVEMMDRLTAHADEVGRHRREFERTFYDEVTPGQETCDGSDEAAMEEAMADVSRLEMTLRDYDAAERQLFADLVEAMNDDGFFDWYDGPAVGALSDQVIALWLSWKQTIQDIRVVYARAGFEPDSWLVRAEPNGLATDFEPDVERFKYLYQRAVRLGNDTNKRHGLEDMMDRADDFAAL